MKSIMLTSLFFVGCLSACGSNVKIKTGSKAPDFSLPDENGKQRTLAEFLGKYVVLYFYPKDNTPGCTKQACSIRDSFTQFEKNNIVVLGVSYDSPAHHKAFKEKHHLPFILLSDQKHTVAGLYGAKRWFFMPFPKRKTFVINPEGKICAVLPDVDVTKHVQDVLQLIEQDKKQ